MSVDVVLVQLYSESHRVLQARREACGEPQDSGPDASARQVSFRGESEDELVAALLEHVRSGTADSIGSIRIVGASDELPRPDSQQPTRRAADAPTMATVRQATAPTTRGGGWNGEPLHRQYTEESLPCSAQSRQRRGLKEWLVFVCLLWRGWRGKAARHSAR